MNRRQSVAAVITIVITVLALALVERLGTTYREGLDVTADAADVTVAGISSARALAAEVAELAAATATVIDSVAEVVRDGAATSSDVGEALRSNVADGIVGTSGVADDLAQFIEFLERLIPGNRDSLAEDLRRVADGLAPLPDQLRDLGDGLTATADRLEASAPGVVAAGGQLANVARRLDDAVKTLDTAEALAEQLADQADDARRRADGDVWSARLLVVLVVGGGGLAVTAGQAGRQSGRQSSNEAT